MKQNSYEFDHTPWNMADQWLKDIAEICKQITESRRVDDVTSWYVLLWDLIDRMQFQFKPEQVKELRDLLDTAGVLINKPLTVQGQQLLQIDKPKIRSILSKCYVQWLGYLNEYERIFAKTQKLSMWEEIQGDFE